MSKSVLVMETPNNCCSCHLCGYAIDLQYCKETLKEIMNISTKPDWCPLKPLPERMTGVASTDHWNSIKAGWNGCIDEITEGEVDD